MNGLVLDAMLLAWFAFLGWRVVRSVASGAARAGYGWRDFLVLVALIGSIYLVVRAG